MGAWVHGCMGAWVLLCFCAFVQWLRSATKMVPAALALGLLAFNAPGAGPCPFCPRTKTATQFGAAASFRAIAGMGKFSLNETMAAVKAEGLDVLGTESYKCEDWAQLPAQLEAAAHYDIKVIAGFESESRLGSYCPNFLVGKKVGGLVDWPGLAAQLANLSLAHPNLIGYRFDDFIGCVHLNQYGNISIHPNREVYYGGLPTDTAKMQAAGGEMGGMPRGTAAPTRTTIL